MVDQQATNLLDNNAMSVDAVLKRAWKILWSRPKLFFGLALLPIIPLLVLLFLGIGVGLAGFNLGDSSDDIRNGLGVLGVLLVIVGVIALIIVSAISQAALIRASLGMVRGEAIAGKAMIEFGKKKWLGFLGLGLVIGVIVLLGLIALIIPGLIFLYWYYLAQYVYIDQNLGVSESLKQSKQLVKGYGSVIVAIALITFVLIMITSFIPLIGDIVSVVISLVLVIAFADIYNHALAKKGKAKPVAPVKTASK